MMNKIILTLKPSLIDGSKWKKPLCVYKYRNPVMGVDTIKFSDFKENPRNLLEDYSTLVILGLTEMMTPSNRTDDVWEFTFNQMSKDCVSIDKYLFKSDPWRIWFHFGILGEKYRDYTYSYLAETDYEKYYNGLIDDNPFSFSEVKKWGSDIIKSYYKKYFLRFNFSIDYKVTPSEEYEYSEKLDELFKEKNTIHQVIKELEKYAQDIYPDREMVTRHQLFRGKQKFDLSITNLPVDIWKASYLERLMKLTNNLANEFYVEEESHEG